MTDIRAAEIPRAATPEAVGVDSKEVQAFIDHCMQAKKQLHSILVLRHGQIACEAYRAPYAPQYAHIMYSVSKSITATAIGFAVAEGLFALDTKFLDIFPEAREIRDDANMQKLCVEDLLTMRSGFSVSPMMDKTKDRWFHDIVSSPWISEPGTKFDYISENMYLLCAMIHRRAGMSVIDYLMPRLFEPLGIERPFWETCPRGIEAGGWGITLKTMDLAKIMLTYQQGGTFGGKQILPAGWAEQATSYHAATVPAKNSLDTVLGYGYCFWRCGGYKNAYRADGMFSQFGIVFEDLDACLIITAGEIEEQGMRDVIWDHFPKAFIDDAPDAETVPISIPPYEKLPAMPRSKTEARLEGKKIVFNKPLLINAIGFPVSALPMTATFMSRDKAGNITNLAFHALESELVMTWTEGKETNTIHIGMDGDYRWGTATLGQAPYHICAVGAWKDANTLEVMIRPIESVAARLLTFKFRGNVVTMKPRMLPDTVELVMSLVGSVKSVFKQPMLKKLISTGLPRVVPLVDMVHVGVLRD
ncbi:MAG: serine hydrolase [Clostridia bacterium]|nr:serine hydrolase [Clostridia bacterium]